MRKKKDNLPKIEYIFDEPTCIDSGEIRIIDNCVIILNAPVTVYGTLIFYNSSIINYSEGITIYGSLKVDKCNISLAPHLFHIMNGGKVFLGSFSIGNELFDWFLCEENGYVGWLPYSMSADNRFDDTIISCVSQFYGIPQKEVCSRIRTDAPKENKIRREAWCVAIYLMRKLANISISKFLRRFNCPSYIASDEIERAEKFVENGDTHLWRNVSEILAKITQTMYANNLAYENSHPYKDLV